MVFDGECWSALVCECQQMFLFILKRVDNLQKHNEDTTNETVVCDPKRGGGVCLDCHSFWIQH